MSRLPLTLLASLLACCAAGCETSRQSPDVQTECDAEVCSPCSEEAACSPGMVCHKGLCTPAANDPNDAGDACALLDCGMSAQCVIGTNGLADCVCRVGFELNDGECVLDDATDCASGFCLRGGVCSPRTEGPHCSCPSGFSGTRCEFDFDDCSSKPCLNGGACVDGPNSYVCRCPKSHEGEHCEIPRVHKVIVALESIAGASGSVSGGDTAETASEPEFTCPGECERMIPGGTNLAFQAVPAPGYYFGGWSGGCTHAEPTCYVQRVDGEVSVTAKFTKANLIFATQDSFSRAQLMEADPSGQGDPIQGADELCRQRAASSTLAEVRSRTWHALLTKTPQSLGFDRFPGARGWLRTDGLPSLDDPSSYAGKSFYPPGLDQNGIRDTAPYNVTLGNGCRHWTSDQQEDRHSTGVSTGSGSSWAGSYGAPCNGGTRMYCISTDYSATVTAPGLSPGAKLAFVTGGSFIPSGSKGLSAADAFCQQEAAASAYPGTFRALLASVNPSTTAAARFASSGPWVRPDGVEIGDYAMLASTTGLALKAGIAIAPPLSTWSSFQYLDHAGVWTGADSPSAAGTDATTCTPTSGLSWTGGSSETGRTGSAERTDRAFFQNWSDLACDRGLRLICLQI